jgi:glycosyltransferase 2 family protein
VNARGLQADRLDAPLQRSRDTATGGAVRPRVVRRPDDLLRLGAGLLILAVTGWAASRGRPGRLEIDVFRLVNDLPAALDRPLEVVMQAGALAAVPVSAGLALLARRWRLGRDLALAGPLAWYLARVVKALVYRPRPGELLSDVLPHGLHATGLGFPSGHVAVAAALATAAGPHLPARVRRVTWVVVALVAVARMYVGAHLPLDVVGGAALGWAVGASTLLLVGVPGDRPGPDTVRRALAAVGIHPTALEPLPGDARASAPYLAVEGGGSSRRLFVKAVGRSHRDADALYRLWRFLTLRQAGDELPYPSVKQQVEHEAYLSLLAARAGVRTPALVASTPTVESTVFLVQEHVDGQAVDKVPPAQLQDATLADLWHQVAVLHAAGIAHRDLRLANVIVDPQGRPWLVDLGFAEAGAPAGQIDADIAQLLTSLAAAVGPNRAVRSALTALEPAQLARCLPLLQSAALPSATRSSLRRRPDLLAELRTSVATATGTTVAALPPLTRIRWRTLVLVLLLGVAVHGLLPQLDQAGRALVLLPTASPGWVLTAVAWSALSYGFAGLALSAASPRGLPLARTAAVQLAGSFANRLTPAGLGGLSVNARYLRRAGLDPTETTSALALNTAAGLLVHVVALVAAAGWVARTGLGNVRLPNRWPVLVVVALVLAAAGCVVFLPRIRHQLLPALHHFAGQLIDITRAPTRAAGLLVSNAGVTLCYVMSLDATVHAYHGHVALIRVVAVYLAAMAVATASPTPGGLGAVETALTAGLTTVHLSFAPALAAVLTFRLATYWLPILPGLVSYRILRRAQTL